MLKVGRKAMRIPMVETTFSVSQEVAVNKIWKEKEFHKAKRRESAKA